jgi:hypothetical protein
VIAEVIACLCTSSVGFPDFILRGEVRDTSFVMGMGKILSPARRHPSSSSTVCGRCSSLLRQCCDKEGSKRGSNPPY